MGKVIEFNKAICSASFGLLDEEDFKSNSKEIDLKKWEIFKNRTDWAYTRDH